MSIRRGHRPVIFVSAVALAALATAGLTLEAGPTSPASPPAVAPAAAIAPALPERMASPASMRLQNGLEALSTGNIGLARGIRDALPANSLDRHVLAWTIALYGGDAVPGADIAAVMKMLPDWPGMTTLRRNEERALYRENPAPDAVIRAFDGRQPETMQGVTLLARAYIGRGNQQAAISVLAPFWRTAKLGAGDEAAMIAEFGAIIPVSVHRFRMERMLYADRVNSALRVAKPARAEGLAKAWAAVIRQDGKAGELLKAVPAGQRSAGYLFAEAEYLRKKHRFRDAAAIMAKAPRDREALVDGDAWWVERRVLSRELADQGDMKTAYRVAADHAAESAANAADAEFHAGWYALRGLNEPERAARHFARIAALAEGPISLSRAYYWLGRAVDAGAPGDAKAYYRKAAAYGTTFYGQLAGERIGEQTLNIAAPVPSKAERAAFAQREAVLAIRRLQAAGFERYAHALYRDLAGELTGPGEVALLAAMAEAQGDHHLALRIGKIAAGRGIDVGALSHPLGVIPDDADVSASGKALAYAIARQESEFNVSAVSSAGAQGLLQLMPGTAAQLAKKAGLPFSKVMLTADPGYNAQLGSAFLGQQLDRFDGSYVLTFAGYNAGPRRAAEWVARYGDPRGKDLDTVVDWIERIPYTETRNYVQRVMENYEVYKMRLTGHFDIAGDLVNGRG
ncbi:lytic transglycosylase domain-containing protein [Manganibacter manganicus]|uniref:Lytic transglycosylase n=1 Tax=Manganibacter manganicus TaxID=1873176 RepID=A0A1V8RK40_9HYPH|nr:lytic transglycosylase domain-containing protein [Pseudaminobacter manganicus]OQM73570.1 lytic transglycosylase [Pseudaminobacter manganicus]